jgi:hypothetical protein
LALSAVAQDNQTAGVSHDLWRFSCEMPDAPHDLLDIDIAPPDLNAYEVNDHDPE